MPSTTAKTLVFFLSTAALASADVALNNEARAADDVSISIPSISISIPSITLSSESLSQISASGTTIHAGTTVYNSVAGNTITGSSSGPSYNCPGSVICQQDIDTPGSCVCCVGDPNHGSIAGISTTCTAGTAEPLTSFASGGSSGMASTTSSSGSVASTTMSSTITTTNSAGSTITSTTASVASATSKSTTSTPTAMANRLAPGMLGAGVVFAAMAL